MTRRILLGSRGLSAAMAAALTGQTSYQDGDETKRIAPLTVSLRTYGETGQLPEVEAMLERQAMRVAERLRTQRRGYEARVQRYQPTDPEIAAWNAQVDRSKGRRP